MSNKTKKIIGYCLLLVNLVVIKLFMGGTYLYHFWEELIPEIIVLLIVSFILIIVSLIFKLKNKKRLEYKKGRNICLLNSLILFVIFSIPNLLNILKDNNMAVMSVDPDAFSKLLILVFGIIAVFYYFINMCFFVDNKK